MVKGSLSMMKKKYLHYSFIGIFVICVSTLFISCGSGPGDTGIGTTATIKIEFITIYANEVSGSWVIPADGASSIRIKLTLTDSSGNPVFAFTPVTFSTTLGHFQGGTTSYSVETSDDSGIAEVSLIAGTTSGVAFITCSSNSVTQSGYVVFADWQGVDVIGETASITLTADPTSIPADGSSSTTITATLTDYIGQPVTTGTYITFFTEYGRFPNNSTSHTAQTPDETGIVNVSLIAGTIEGDNQVTALSNSVSQSITVEFTREGGETASITLTADPTSIPADGSSSTTITATLTNSTGGPVTRGTNITFSTEYGRFPNNSTTYTTQTSDATGIVNVSLIAGTIEGDNQVTALSNSVSQSITIAFTPI